MTTTKRRKKNNKMTTATTKTATTAAAAKYFFYDSYAVIEYLNGNQRYRQYFEDENVDGVLTKLNLMEVYFKVLRTIGQKAAKEVLDSFSRYLTDFDLAAIEGAMQLRLGIKNSNHVDISYADAISYHLAKKLGMRFLTGDIAFKNLSNVEFVQ